MVEIIYRDGREKGRSEKNFLLVRIQTFVVLQLIPADADAEIVGVTTSELVGVSGKFEFEMPSRPRSSKPRRI